MSRLPSWWNVDERDFVLQEQYSKRCCRIENSYVDQDQYDKIHNTSRSDQYDRWSRRGQQNRYVYQRDSQSATTACSRLRRRLQEHVSTRQYSTLLLVDDISLVRDEVMNTFASRNHYPRKKKNSKTQKKRDRVAFHVTKCITRTSRIHQKKLHVCLVRVLIMYLTSPPYTIHHYDLYVYTHHTHKYISRPGDLSKSFSRFSIDSRHIQNTKNLDFDWRLRFPAKYESFVFENYDPAVSSCKHLKNKHVEILKAFSKHYIYHQFICCWICKQDPESWTSQHYITLSCMHETYIYIHISIAPYSRQVTHHQKVSSLHPSDDQWDPLFCRVRTWMKRRKGRILFQLFF